MGDFRSGDCNMESEHDANSVLLQLEIGEDSAGMALVENLQLWVDPVRRHGPESMAVDEWLLETVSSPVLRVYGWEGEWASIGYFGKISEARLAFPSASLVRRWTGGGMVDHREDWTYSLVLPADEMLARVRGAESYRVIHEKLMQTLEKEGGRCRMSEGDSATGSASCFENPVGFDLIDQAGRKLAGAGQRRSRRGLLHQGSVSLRECPGGGVVGRSEFFADLLARRCSDFSVRIDTEEVCRKAIERYSSASWMNRR